jgi:hypothetical protein
MNANLNASRIALRTRPCTRGYTGDVHIQKDSLLLVVLAGVSAHFTFQLVFEAAATDSAINSDVGITPTLETFGT